MDDAQRKPLVALVVLLVIAIPVVVVILAGASEEGPPEKGPAAAAPAGGLRVEPTGGGLSELTVTLEDPSVNTPSTAGNADMVTLECVDLDGQAVLSEPQVWPFGSADDLSLGPHVHVGLEPAQMDQVARCRLLGTDPPLEGRRL